MGDGWKPLGNVVQLQIQRNRLTGDDFDPTPILKTDSIVVGEAGAVAASDGGWLLDSHHRDHPARVYWNADRVLSLGFTSHYGAMEQYFGAAPLGCAGENVTVSADEMVTADRLAGGVLIRGGDRRLELSELKIAQPCLPFTRFLLGDSTSPEGPVEAHRDFLRGGMRGFVVGLQDLDQAVELRVGDEVLVGT